MRRPPLPVVRDAIVFDLIIRGGEVIDGRRAPRYRADVGVQGDRIVAIGDLRDVAAQTVLDAAGHVVAPGFIDVHNHSDGWLLRRHHIEAKTRQGFTTEVLMSDGISYAPVDEHTARPWLFYLRSLNGLRLDEYTGWQSLADYRDLLHGRNVQNNALQVPYGNVRTLICGFSRRRVDDAQRRLIQAEIRRGMEAGAVALSTGLDYLGQIDATTEELVDAASVLKAFDAPYVTHVRYKLGLLPAVKEAVEIGRRAGVKVHISHLKPLQLQHVEELLDYIDREARRQVDLSFDVYPYLPGSTMLNSLLPYECWDAGPLPALGKLHDPRIRRQFRRNLEHARVPLNSVHIAWVPGRENARFQGWLLSDYVRETGKPPEDALLDLLLEERLAVLCVFHEGDDRLTQPLLQHDLAMIGSDAIYHDDACVHPRAFGTAPRVLGRCVRDWKLFSLEEAVYKLSYAAAERFRLPLRGAIVAGYFADLVVFDPRTVNDPATYREPRQFPVGITHVIVNGRVILRYGVPESLPPGPLPGRSLQRDTPS